ncbi:MAG: NAD(P)/FAD-dependent oxidoreductase [Actinomycetota bacterium]|nr:NAD(P)/FAD-dependent oxidoreductase [Actinomycetota bacterium]
MTWPRVVVIGAGFGGIAAAHELACDPVDITIVDRNNFHTFQPLLYQVATAGLNSADVAFPVRAIFRRQPNVTFRKASVRSVDWERATLAVDEGNDIGFDHLVVAAGATTNTFGIDGAEHALPLYSLRDAVALRNHVLSQFELAASQPDAVVDGQLTFVVVGGGPTGVEVAGALVELFDQVLRKDFRSLDMSRAVVVLVEMRDDLLASFHPPSRRHARETLASRGVDVRTGAVVDRITPAALHLRSGAVIATETVIWAAGVRADSLASVLGVAVGAGGRVVVGSDLTIPGHTGAYAVGDIAEIPGRDGPLPQVAQVAMQAGRHAARQVRASLDGASLRPFKYRDKGTMATIGRRAAVTELPIGLRLRGTLAWLAWLGLHLVYLAGFRNRISVFLNWAWNYATWDRGPRLILDQPPARDAVTAGEPLESAKTRDAGGKC